MRSSRIRPPAAFVAALVAVALVAGSAAADDLSESKGFRKAVTLGRDPRTPGRLAVILECQWRQPRGRLARLRRIARLCRQQDDGRRLQRDDPGIPIPVQRRRHAADAAADQPDADDLCRRQRLRDDDVLGFDRVHDQGRVGGRPRPAECTGPGATTSGCEAADFAGMPAGSIALMQRGTCTFGQKTDNAIAAGAVAAIIFNDGGDAAASRSSMGPSEQGRTAPPSGPRSPWARILRNGITTGATGSTVTIRDRSRRGDADHPQRHRRNARRRPEPRRRRRRPPRQRPARSRDQRQRFRFLDGSSRSPRPMPRRQRHRGTRSGSSGSAPRNSDCLDRRRMSIR